ncbi:constitutive coactivator of PPAR-gamma-like protein 1 homolog isoform X2 [Callorhinchus milii]|uniref:constitutive coactivator of PPAR-gamma-like protein 1 homolog isoform X2 n=1 Tax=Callorhinchus milii TaxID=7868 RepID=UPI001C3F6AC6|nr:constitutive coactivator of PPAR-gamma-like protein 1 homolog isoform X2 [Callorhinchus milii]
MGVQGFQEFIERHCSAAVVPVELQKLARARAARHRAAGGTRGPGSGPFPPPPLRLLLDAESGLHRLYGGYFTDWVSGGQWNQMLGFVAALSQACAAGGVQLVVAFNGALAKSRLPDWGKRQLQQRQSSQLIVNHIHSKGTPPPKVWFLPPPGLAACLRLALLRFRVQVIQSTEDHHQEVLSFYRENGFHGLIAYDSEYALCNVQCYLSAHALKLSWNGKSLTTNQFLMQEVAKQLNVNPAYFSIFAALLGNHILPDEDLAAFHWSLLGPDHPLASLKVRAQQLVLPPCDVVIKSVAVYVSNIPDVSDLDTVARDVFKHSQSRTQDKIDRFKRAVEYYAMASKPQSIPLGPAPLLLQGFAPSQFGMPSFAGAQIPGVSQPKHVFPQHMMQKLPYQAFPPGHNPGLFFSPSHSHLVQGPSFDPQATKLPLGQKGPGPLQQVGKHVSLSSWSGTPVSSSIKINNHMVPKDSSLSSPDMEENRHRGGTSTNHIPKQQPPHKVTGARESTVRGNPEGFPDTRPGVRKPTGCVTPVSPTAHIPSLLSMQTRSHMDITTPPLPQVAPEVLRVADHRHRKGLMYPYIYQVLTTGELKLPVCIEDEANSELPPATLLYRSARQYVYGVLFSLSETQRRAQRLAMRRRIPVEVPPVIIKEWAAYKGKSPQTPELVTGLIFREWTCPNLRKLWLGKAVEDKNRRMRAFLACLKSDTPAMLNPANVPTHLLLLCCVLRYMMHWPGGRILHRQELDAFLAQAVSSKLYEPDLLQELKIDKLDARGVELAALFMSGVDTALFANDACGQPIPWEHCCPWIYFDGKLFHSKMVRATQQKVPLLELCDGQADQVAKVEKMRQSILEGLNFSRHPLPPPSMLRPPFAPPMMGPFYPMPVYSRPVGSVPPPHGRGRCFAGMEQIAHQGGKLEIAGMVVGQWAGSRPARGRGSLNLQVVSVGGHGKGRGRDRDPLSSARAARGSSHRNQANPTDNSQNQGGAGVTAPGETMRETPGPAPSENSSHQGPPEEVDTDTHVPVELPSEAAAAPIDTPSEMPRETSREIPRDTPGPAPSDTPSKTLGAAPSETPRETPGPSLEQQGPADEVDADTHTDSTAEPEPAELQSEPGWGQPQLNGRADGANGEHSPDTRPQSALMKDCDVCNRPSHLPSALTLDVDCHSGRTAAAAAQQDEE